MILSEKEKKIKNPDEMSVKDIVYTMRSAIKYLKSKYITILVWGILGCAIGLVYAIFNKTKYTATCTFVLDGGNRESTLGQYADLASFAGIDIGGGSANGIFSGDNILELYKSRLMIEKSLLTNGAFNGKSEMLIDRYIDFNQLRERWKTKNHIDSITFSGNPDKFNRKQDSIIADIVKTFNKKILSVTKPDKKLSIISVAVTTNDELFSKEFDDKLVQNVNQFYIQTKTKIANQNVEILQKQADSVRSILNSSINGVAAALDASPNANPSLLSLRVPSQRKQIDVQASSAIYEEIIKNLELAKVALMRGTPLIQVIDKPILPLESKKVGKLLGAAVGGIIGIFFIITILWLKKNFGKIE